MPPAANTAAAASNIHSDRDGEGLPGHARFCMVLVVSALSAADRRDCAVCSAASKAPDCMALRSITALTVPRESALAQSAAFPSAQTTSNGACECCCSMRAACARASARATASISKIQGVGLPRSICSALSMGRVRKRSPSSGPSSSNRLSSPESRYRSARRPPAFTVFAARTTAGLVS